MGPLEPHAQVRLPAAGGRHGCQVVGGGTIVLVWKYVTRGAAVARAEMTNCDFEIVDMDEISRKSYGLATQQGSPFKDALNEA